MPFNCTVKDFGCTSFAQVYEYQKQCVKRSWEEKLNFLLLGEHWPIITAGRLAKSNSLLICESYLKERAIDYMAIDRGGDLTMHAPGQLILYPIFQLNDFGRDIHAFLHNLEQVVIDLLNDFDILAHRFEGRTGVFWHNQKLASIGIGVKKWISYHGIGLNVNTDLSLFSFIKPCGLNIQMTSMACIKSTPIAMEDVKQTALKQFKKTFRLSFQDEKDRGSRVG